MLWMELLFGLVVIYFVFRYYLTKNHNYWQKRNVPGPKPLLIYGSFKDVHFQKISVIEYLKSLYDSYPNEPAVGLFANTTPILLVRDRDMIKEILIKHFLTFPERGVKIHYDIEPLAQNLVFLEYERWKLMRQNLTPAFASGKLKEMFYLANDCVDNFVEYLKDLLSTKNEVIELREHSSKLSIDVIGVCAFGLNMNAISNEGSEFRKIGRDQFANTLTNKFRLLTRLLPHWIAVILKPIVQNDKMANFFINSVKSTMDYRIKNNIRRNDFFDLLVDIRNNPRKVGEEEMSDIMLTAQAFGLLMAGYETSSTSLSNAMYELALHPDVQDKLREEVELTFKKNNGKLSYDIIKNMKYLEKIMQETFRKYPVIPTLLRKTVSDHTFAEQNLSITKGTEIFIPIYSIHYDPNIYPNPEKFDPERFEFDAIESRPHTSYFPFGDGPRICIGYRFACMLLKLSLANIIKHFKIEVCDKTPKQYEKRTGLFLLLPKCGLYVKLKQL